MSVAMDERELRQVVASPMAVVERMLQLEDGRLYGEAMEPFQRQFFEAKFATQPDGRPEHRMGYREDVRGGSKTTDAAAAAVAELITGPRGHRSYAVAGDQDQAALLVDSCRGFADRSPLVAQFIKVDRFQVRNKLTGSELKVMSADAPTSYGLRIYRATFDEMSVQETDRLWVSLWSGIGKSPLAQMWVLSMAGFDLSSVGYRVRELARTTPEYFFQTRQDAPLPRWLTEQMLEEQRRTLPPGDFDRLFRAVWTELATSGIDITWWDRATTGRQVVADRALDVTIGLDVGWKSDSTALIGTTFDPATKRVRVVNHAVFTPKPGEPVDLEYAVEQTIRDWSRRFRVAAVYADPWLAARSVQSLRAAGIHVEEYPQTPSNISAATDALFQLLRSESLVGYDCPEIRSALQSAALVSTPRGWRLEKAKSSGKIDAAVALAISCKASLDLLTDQGFDFGGTIVSVVRTGMDGVRRAVDSVGNIFTADDTDDHPVPSAGKGEEIIEHPGLYDGNGRTAAVGRSAASHPANRSCGVCERERRDAAVRAGVSYPIAASAGLVQRAVGRLGSEFVADHVAAERAMSDGTAYCGGCQRQLRHGHAGNCPEALLLSPEEATCSHCRARTGHESDCPMLTELVNAGDPGAW